MSQVTANYVNECVTANVWLHELCRDVCQDLWKTQCEVFDASEAVWHLRKCNRKSCYGRSLDVRHDRTTIDLGAVIRAVVVQTTAAAPASKVEAVVRSPTDMARAKIAAVDFNKMMSFYRRPACDHVRWGRAEVHSVAQAPPGRQVVHRFPPAVSRRRRLLEQTCRVSRWHRIHK